MGDPGTAQGVSYEMPRGQFHGLRHGLRHSLGCATDLYTSPSWVVPWPVLWRARRLMARSISGPMIC